MRKTGSRSVLAVASVVMAMAGCYTTQIYTPAPAEDVVHDDRQWFFLAGLVDLSDPAGDECEAGVARMESEFDVIDGLIFVGLSAAGGVVGGFACQDIEDEAAESTCISAFQGVAHLIGSRSVHYQCVAQDAAAEVESSLLAGAQQN